MKLHALSLARLKRWLIPLGWTLVVLALGLVAQRLVSGGGAALLFERPDALWTVVPAAVVYGGICILLTAAWWALLRSFARGGPPFSTAHRIFALSQIGKYLPGNVMHFVGRAAMARAEGISIARAGFTMVQESVLMMTAALGVAAVLGGTHWLGLPPELTLPATLLMILAALAVSSAPHIAARFGLGRAGEPSRIGADIRRLAWTGVAFLAYAIFFCLSGALFLALMDALGAPVPWPLGIAVVCAAWLLGFVTPGASAGIGIREAVLIGVLEPHAGAAATAAALLFRLVTTGGDVVLFATGVAARRRELKDRAVAVRPKEGPHAGRG